MTQTQRHSRFTSRTPTSPTSASVWRAPASRFPDQAPGEAWAYGTDVAYLRELVEYWRDGFDWRAEEAALNAFPQFRVAARRHRPALSARARRRAQTRCRCSLLHGWPGSVFEFLDIIPAPHRSGPLRRRCPRRFHGGGAVACRATAFLSSRVRRDSACPKWPIVSPR